MSVFPASRLRRLRPIRPGPFLVALRADAVTLLTDRGKLLTQSGRLSRMGFTPPGPPST
jgi:hypothetical protein